MHHQAPGHRVCRSEKKHHLLRHCGQEELAISNVFLQVAPTIWVFPNIGVFPQNGWFIMENMENSIKMDDLGVPLFSETSIFWCHHFWCEKWCAFETSGTRRFFSRNLRGEKSLSWCLRQNYKNLSLKKNEWGVRHWGSVALWGTLKFPWSCASHFCMWDWKENGKKKHSFYFQPASWLLPMLWFSVMFHDLWPNTHGHLILHILSCSSQLESLEWPLTESWAKVSFLWRRLSEALNRVLHAGNQLRQSINLKKRWTDVTDEVVALNWVILLMVQKSWVHQLIW